MAARFRPEPESKGRGVGADEVVSIVNQLMCEGFYAEEFAYLEEPNLNRFEMLPIVANFLSRLEWRPSDDVKEFRFMTALYAEHGQKDDIAAYHCIRRWMDDVGHELNDRFSDQYVADGIDASNLYACYYSYSHVTGDDLIESVTDPQKHDWAREGVARPKDNFAEWSERNPEDLTIYRPIDIQLLKTLSV